LHRTKKIINSALLCLLLPLAAFAKKDEPASDAKALEKRAKEHYEQGKDYYANQRYEEALTEFESAYRITPSEELEVNIGYALWGMGRTDDAKKRFRRSYRSAEDPAIQAASLDALQKLTTGEIGADGLTKFPRKAAQISLMVSGSAAAVGLITGGIALEQAFIEGKQGFAKPQGLINATNIAFSVSAGAALASAGFIFTQRGAFSKPVQLFVSPTQASVAFQF
jgi:tetratricopeptide (TPR) repeat protein